MPTADASAPANPSLSPKVLGSGGPGGLQNWLLPHHAYLGPRCGVRRYAARRWACSLRRWRVVAASSHSLRQASKPRQDIVVIFWQVLIWPITGSMVWARSLSSARPQWWRHPPGGARRGRQLGQVTAPGGITDAVGGGVFAKRGKQP